MAARVFGLEECCLGSGSNRSTRQAGLGGCGRSRRSREPALRAGHPLVGAVREELVLPDRHLSLDGVHQIRTRGEGGPPVTSAHHGHERSVADCQPPPSMDHRHGHHIMTAADLLRHLFQTSTRIGVSFVFKVDHGSAKVMVADRSDEANNGASPTMGNQALKLSEADGVVNDVGEHDRARMDVVGHGDILPYGLR